MNCPICGMNTLVFDEQLNRRRRFVDGRLQRGQLSGVVVITVWCDNDGCSLDSAKDDRNLEFNDARSAMKALRKIERDGGQDDYIEA